MASPKPASVKVKVGRKRRAAGWTFVALGLLVAGVWVASGWWELYANYQRVTSNQLRIGEDREDRSIMVGDGVVSFRHQWGRDKETTAVIRRATGPVRWKMWPLKSELGFWYTFPMWPIPLLLWTPAALLLRSASLARRRANTEACAKCGYSLAGLGADAPCPECGKATAPAST